jgi:two-component system phosphate regulon response regulator PhoB
MNQILAIDDSEDTLLAIEHALGYKFNVTKAQTIKEARSAQKKTSFDLIILDLGLPDGDGLSLCANLKTEAQTKSIPLIMLTGKQQIEDKVMGFSAGADDYIVKPFHPQELRSRVEARMRDQQKNKEENEIFCIGDLIFDISKQRVTIDKIVGQKKISLTTLEFRMLLFFGHRQEQVLSRSQLLNSVWGGDINVFDRTIDTHISHIRKKISESDWRIESVHGAGYRMVRSTTQAS